MCLIQQNEAHWKFSANSNFLRTGLFRDCRTSNCSDFGVKAKDVHYPLLTRPICWMSAASATMQSLRCARVLARSLPVAQSTSALLRPSAYRVSSPQMCVLFVLDPLHNRVANVTVIRLTSTRALSLLSPRRPQFLPPSFAVSPSASPSTASSTPPTAADGTPLDLVPKISSHPAVLGMQVRNGPRNTFDPSHRVRKRRHGFLARLKSRTGRKVLKRRTLKGRRSLTH